MTFNPRRVRNVPGGSRNVRRLKVRRMLDIKKLVDSSIPIGKFSRRSAQIKIFRWVSVARSFRSNFCNLPVES